jgi:nucleoside-diphosphate kinase
MLVFLKPDAFETRVVGKVIDRLLEEEVTIVSMRMIQLTKQEAQLFYKEHQGKGFYESLTNYVSRGPILVIVLQSKDHNLIQRIRNVMGATHPREALPSSIRGRFGKGMDNNIIHGSDSPESAQREIAFFFNKEVPILVG